MEERRAIMVEYEIEDNVAIFEMVSEEEVERIRVLGSLVRHE